MSPGNDGEATFIPQQYGCLGKNQTMIASIDMITGKRENSRNITHRQRNTGKRVMLREWGTLSSSGVCHLAYYAIPKG